MANINIDILKDSIVLDPFKYQGAVYLKDDYGRIWNMDTELIGVIIRQDELGNYECEMFDKDYQIGLKCPVLD